MKYFVILLVLTGTSVIIIATSSVMIFGNDNKPHDPLNLEYLRALQELCKQNENSDSVTIIDGDRWQNSTHYFDMPDCQFRKLISSDHMGVLENER